MFVIRSGSVISVPRNTLDEARKDALAALEEFIDATSRVEIIEVTETWIETWEINKRPVKTSYNKNWLQAR